MFDKALAGLKHIGQALLKAPAAGHEDGAPEHAAAPLQGADLAKTQTAEAAALSQASDVVALRHTADAIWASLGGQANVRSLDAVAGTRLRVELMDPTQFNLQQGRLAGVLAVAQLSTQLMHLIVGPQAPLLAADWRARWRVP